MRNHMLLNCIATEASPRGGTSPQLLLRQRSESAGRPNRKSLHGCHRSVRRLKNLQLAVCRSRTGRRLLQAGIVHGEAHVSPTCQTNRHRPIFSCPTTSTKFQSAARLFCVQAANARELLVRAESARANDTLTFTRICATATAAACVLARARPPRCLPASRMRPGCKTPCRRPTAATPPPAATPRPAAGADPPRG